MFHEVEKAYNIILRFYSSQLRYNTPISDHLSYVCFYFILPLFN